jgi:toxin ParE1/3/4
MVRVVWSDSAIADLNEIFDFLALDNPAAATRIATRLIAAAQKLEVFPHRGRPAGERARELAIVWPYLIRYAVAEDEVRVLTVQHGARDRTDQT